MKSETRTKTIEVNVWVADDGKEFTYEQDCIEYERKLNGNDFIHKAEELRINELDDIIPIDGHALPSENNNYRWYKVKSVEDMEALEGAYGERLPDVSSFPEIVCVEYNGGDVYCGDAYGYTLHDIMLETKDFFEKLGYVVDFTKVGEVPDFDIALVVSDGIYYDYDGLDSKVKEVVKEAVKVEDRVKYILGNEEVSPRDKNKSLMHDGLYLYNNLELVAEYE